MTTTPPNGSKTVPVYILAGGKSRRYGADKARVLHGGVPLLVHVAETLRPVASAVTVVAAAGGAYDDLGLRTIGDTVEGKGPLGGLLAALDDCGEGWLFLSACDWVGVRAEWARDLIRLGATTPREAVLFRTHRWEPLFALYRSTIRTRAARVVRGDDVSMRALLELVDVLAVEAPAGWADVVNLNRPPGRQEGASDESEG
jgi:molybdopterin-guanine dinucleotide biosynthesis protein A